MEPEGNDVTSDSGYNLVTKKIMHNMGEFIKHSYEVFFVPDTDVECITVQSK